MYPSPAVAPPAAKPIPAQAGVFSSQQLAQAAFDRLKLAVKTHRSAVAAATLAGADDAFVPDHIFMAVLHAGTALELAMRTARDYGFSAATLAREADLPEMYVSMVLGNGTAP